MIYTKLVCVSVCVFFCKDGVVHQLCVAANASKYAVCEHMLVMYGMLRV